MLRHEHTPAHTHTRAHAHTHTHTRAHAHTTHAQTRTDTSAHLRTHTHARAHTPVHHSRKPLPGAEGGHVLQLFVGDPGRHQQQLRVAGAEPGGAGTQRGARLADGQLADPWTRLTHARAKPKTHYITLHYSHLARSYPHTHTHLYTTENTRIGNLFQERKAATFSSSLSVIQAGTSSSCG